MSTVEKVAPPEAPSESTLVLPSLPAAGQKPFRPAVGGWISRALAWAALAWLVLALPGNILSPVEVGVTDVRGFATMIIYAIIGLSLNVLIGYAGQISLGHQAFVGMGAFASAYAVTDLGLEFWLALPLAVAFSVLQAGLLGLVSLRLTGLYFALVTLAYGFFAEETLFSIEALTGGDAGKLVERPLGFEDQSAYYYLCVAGLAVVLWLDWRLTKSKAGRALQALRENPRVASAYGINVKRYTLLAFMVSGLFAGIAGVLLAHNTELVQAASFDFRQALVFVMMTVIGGLRNRAGVVVGSVFFALLMSGKLIEGLGLTEFFEATIGMPKEFFGLVIGPFLLLLVITVFPGGIGQLIAPVKEWMLGRRFALGAGKVKEVTVNDVRA